MRGNLSQHVKFPTDKLADYPKAWPFPTESLATSTMKWEAILSCPIMPGIGLVPPPNHFIYNGLAKHELCLLVGKSSVEPGKG
jgi:hypothetical protein